MCCSDSRSVLPFQGTRSAFGLQIPFPAIFGVDPTTGNGKRDLQNPYRGLDLPPRERPTEATHGAENRAGGMHLRNFFSTIFFWG